MSLHNPEYQYNTAVTHADVAGFAARQHARMAAAGWVKPNAVQLPVNGRYQHTNRPRKTPQKHKFQL